MLSSLTKHFNDTVYRGPDNEGGTDGGTEGNTVLDTDIGIPDGGADAGDGDGGEGGGEPSKPLSVREQLKKSIAEANEDAASQAQAKPKKDIKTGRFSQTKEQAPADGVAPATIPAAPTIAAPDSLSKEAKAEWDKAPQAIKEAFIKREQDSARGVQELKQRYEQIDQALAPHNDALRQMNASPGEAVNRLFLWFKALAGSPVQAFPELAKSMGYDWGKVVEAISGAQKPAQQQQQPQQIPEYVQQLQQEIAQLKGNFGQFGNQFQNIQQEMNAQNEAKTRENLNLWSNGKEFFEDVRQDMAQLIQSGMIPLKSGQVDLDTAYERAIYYNPDVRAKVLAKQQQANQQVQQTADAATTAQRQGQTARARKAAVSLPASSTPGAGNGQMLANRKPGQRTSVKDSLKEAIAQLRDQ